MKQKILAVACAVCFLLSIACTLSGCYTSSNVGISDAKINDNGELILSYEDGRQQNLGKVVGSNGADGQNGSLVISDSGSNVSAASAKGLMSAVSIVSKFQTTVHQGGWGPSFGSTATKEYSSAGSGVIYKLDKTAGNAFIITNYHVVYDASSNTENGISQDISIYLYGSEIEEKAISATYVGGSLYYDIAVLRVEDSEILRSSHACQVEITNSDTVAVGDSAIAIGNAQSYGISASCGIVSVDSEYITMTAADGRTSVSFRVFRVDTAVNSGNSGGGLYDGQGQLIGIVNAKIVDDGVENIGYAIPSNVAIAIADNIIDYCYGTQVERVQRALLGISVTTTDSKAVYDSETGTVHIEEQVCVYEVTKNSLADGLLQAGDVLLSATVNGRATQITRQYHVIDMMLSVRVGDTVSFVILRDGQESNVDITITADCLTAY